jgi:hypothetical protein
MKLLNSFVYSTVFCFVLLHCALGSITWRTLTPIGEQPRTVNKPNFVSVGNGRIAMLNGIQDDCNTGNTTSYSNGQIYIYNTKDNTGKYIPATGDVPSTSLFVHYWKDGDRKIITGGGVYYNVQFTVIDFKPFNPLYMLTISSNYNSAVWSKIIPTGDIPSPRTEMSVIQDGTSNEMYLYGGVSIQEGGFTSFGEVYKYEISKKKFTLLSNGSRLDDGSDGIPKSRYHAHIFITKLRGDHEFEIHQGVHSAGGANPLSEELMDTWRFNINERIWRQIFPNPPISLTRRHGVEFQLKIRGRDIFCTSLGDLTHVDEIPTQGCLYPIVTENSTVCSNSRDNNNQGAWFNVPTQGPIVNSKYPGYAVIGEKIYVVAGEHEEYLSETSTKQVFNTKIRVLDFSDY